MKFILIIFILYSNILGCFIVDHNLDENILSKHMNYFIVDDSQNLDPTFILNKSDMKKVSNSGLGMQFGKFVWTKVSIKNQTGNKKTLFLYNPRAGVDFIDTYIFTASGLSKNFKLGDSRDKTNKEIFSRFSTIKLELQPFETLNIVSKISNPHGRIDIQWIIMSEQKYYKFMFTDLIIWGIIFSGIAFTFILQMFFYSTLKRNYFIDYMLFTVATFSYLLFYNGFGYLIFDAGKFNNVMTHITGYSLILLYIVFLNKFLNIKKDSTLSKNILRIIYVFAIYFAATSWIIYFSPIVYQFDDYYFMLNVLIIIAFITVTFKEIRLNNKISKAILFGQLITLVGYFLFALNGLQIIETKSYLQQILGIAVLLEMFFFSYAISSQIKYAAQDKEKTEKLILSQSHFSTIGQTLRNIAHQWKVPMVRFGTLLTELETTMMYKKIYDHRSSEVMQIMRNNLNFMSQTIDDFQSFYSKEDLLDLFSPYDAICDVQMILLEKIQNLNGEVIFNDNFSTLKIKCSQRSFTHVTMIIINNAIDIAEQRKIDKPIISIKSQPLKDSIAIYFEDNCGGIEQNPIDSIFNIDVTSHHGGNRGSGLSIAKMLVEEKMFGTLKVTNTNNGALFKILLPLEISQDNRK